MHREPMLEPLWQGSVARSNNFDCRCAKRRNIRLRFGEVGKNGSLAVVERLIDTLK
jgi:hypothetical protein